MGQWRNNGCVRRLVGLSLGRCVRFALLILIWSVANTAQAITSGAPPDTPSARVDANTTTSPWAGVGSLTINGPVYSATAIGRRHVLTAAHVAQGQAPDTIRFNLNYGGDLTHQIPAASVSVHPGFVGFNTPNLQHDIAIIELTQDIPAGVPIYPLFLSAVATGQTLTLVGYGASGQGSVGISVVPAVQVKRTGRNNADAFEVDVDGSGRSALYFFDFDGGSAANYYGGTSLGNAIETTFAYGDSGSPSFVNVSGQWQLAGVNTFVLSFAGGSSIAGTFGTGGGGNLVYAYQSWIQGVLARPGNDTFVNRFNLPGTSGQVSATNSGATKQTGEPAHAGNAGGRSVWWRWVPTQTGNVTIDTVGSAFDTLLAIYTGSSVNALTLVSSNDNASGAGTASRVTFVAQSGTEYAIAVDGNSGAQGALTLRWAPGNMAAPPDAEIPTLPEWAAIVLAAVLLLRAIAMSRRA